MMIKVFTYERNQFTHCLPHHPDVLEHNHLKFLKLKISGMNCNLERTLLMYISTIAFGQQMMRTNRSAMLTRQDKKVKSRQEIQTVHWCTEERHLRLRRKRLVEVLIDLYEMRTRMTSTLPMTPTASTRLKPK